MSLLVCGSLDLIELLLDRCGTNQANAKIPSHHCIDRWLLFKSTLSLIATPTE